MVSQIAPWIGKPVLMFGYANVRNGSKAALTDPKPNFRFTPESGLNSDIAPCPKSADIVAKVENRTMPKISRKRIFRHIYRYNTP
jgi:hypothetical protein